MTIPRAESHHSPTGKPQPRIGITMGDPAGIGPEVVLKAVAEEEVRSLCVPIIIGNAEVLAHNARTLDLQCGYEIVRQGEQLPDQIDAPIIFHLDNLNGFVEPGIESGAARKAAGSYIEAAVNLCAAGSIDAMATAPINKRSLFLGGYSFPGHTEFLASLTGTEEYAMGFIAANLRIVLLSTHVPLAEAIRLVTKERIENTIRLADRELQRWGVDRPRIAVAALNPHGAEGGLFGMEEVSEMAPAIEACRVRDGINARGPFSADTVYLRARGRDPELQSVAGCRNAPFPRRDEEPRQALFNSALKLDCRIWADTPARLRPERKTVARPSSGGHGARRKRGVASRDPHRESLSAPSADQ